MSKRNGNLLLFLTMAVLALTACIATTGPDAAAPAQTTDSSNKDHDNHESTTGDHNSDDGDHDHKEEAGHDQDGDMPNHDDDDSESHSEHEHEEMGDGRVPNNGAAIRILSPADGDTFATGEAVTVEIATDNITVGEDGNHWHVYVDDSSWSMVMGRNLSEVVRGLEPGPHELAVYLSIDTHEELERGDSITIIVAE